MLKDLKGKFKIVILHPDTYEEKGGFDTSKTRITIYTILVVLLIVAATASLIVFTPIRELIPGYTDVTLNRRIYETERRTDSLETAMRQKDQYINNLHRIIYCEDMPDDSLLSLACINKGVTPVLIKDDMKSEQDSLFRVQFESESKLNFFGSGFVNTSGDGNMPALNVPLKGKIINHYDLRAEHFGVDITAIANATVKAVGDGTVIFADHSSENGYIVAIQHINNVISIYKNTESLTCHEGDVVRGGDAIAIVEKPKKKSNKSHLHFEIWCNGVSLNPEEYISFE